MTYDSKFSEALKDTMKKIKKKNSVLFYAAIGKIREIVGNPGRYKTLSYGLKCIKRVHLLKSFVLVFRVVENENMIEFLDLDHHDKIYKKKYIGEKNIHH